MLPRNFIKLLIFIINSLSVESFIDKNQEVPKFSENINNLTVTIGRDATLVCTVDDLGTYRVAWLRVDTQTILTIASHVITKNHRVSVRHSDKRIWYLTLQDIRQSDRGWYMCQINTDPMKSQIAYLDVVVPPDILDYQTSGDQVVREGSNVSMKCAAFGIPIPQIIWRKESGEILNADNFVDTQNSSINNSLMQILRVNRLNMGAYLCIASNGVPPSISKRLMLIVHFPPMVWIQNQLIGANEDDTVHLECHSEAFPRSITYWMFNDHIISHANTNFLIEIKEHSGYETDMKLTIKHVGRKYYGNYKCVSKNSLGDTDGNIKIYSLHGESNSRETSEVLLYEEYNESISEPAAAQSSSQVIYACNIITFILFNFRCLYR